MSEDGGMSEEWFSKQNKHIFGCIQTRTYVYPTHKKKPVRRVEYVLLRRFAASIYTYIEHARKLLLKIMAVLAKVSTLHERLPSVLVHPCLYYCCTAHQALAALRSLCTEGRARTVRSMCVGVRNVIRGPQLLYSSRKFGQVILMRTTYTGTNAQTCKHKTGGMQQ